MDTKAQQTRPSNERAPFYKTAFAAISCARFTAGKCVAVRYSYTGVNGVDWYEINKTEDGRIDPVYYPAHHLAGFCY